MNDPYVMAENILSSLPTGIDTHKVPKIISEV